MLQNRLVLVIFLIGIAECSYADSASNSLSLSLPSSGMNYQSDKFRAGDLDCSNSIGSATNIEFGLTSIIQGSSLSNAGHRTGDIGVYAQITIPLGKRNKNRIENELVISKLDNAIVYTRDIKNNLRDDLLKLEVYIDKIDKKVEASGDRIKETQASIDLVLEDVLNEMNQVQKDVTVSIREVEALIRESEKDVRDNLRETEARLDQSMKKLEYTINQRLQELLDNPLSN